MVTRFSVKKISSDPSQAQVDQEGHHDLSTIPSLTANPGHMPYQHAIIQNSFPRSLVLLKVKGTQKRSD